MPWAYMAVHTSRAIACHNTRSRERRAGVTVGGTVRVKGHSTVITFAWQCHGVFIGTPEGSRCNQTARRWPGPSGDWGPLRCHLAELGNFPYLMFFFDWFAVVVETDCLSEVKGLLRRRLTSCCGYPKQGPLKQKRYRNMISDIFYQGGRTK